MAQRHEPEAFEAPKQHPQGVQPLGSRLMNSKRAGSGNVRDAGSCESPLRLINCQSLRHHALQSITPCMLTS